MKTIIESHYFPSLEYLSFIKSKSEIWIESKEHFVKQTYRNRCYILSTDRTLPLAVPVINGNSKIPIDEVLIDYNQKWLNNHWRAIISAYNKSPFFEYYEAQIYEILFDKNEKLLDLNLNILSFCLKVLNIDTKIYLTKSYEMSDNNLNHDMRSVIHPKKESFYRKPFHSNPYLQIFGEKFVPNLSILDLLSCVGPESDSYL